MEHPQRILQGWHADGLFGKSHPGEIGRLKKKNRKVTTTKPKMIESILSILVSIWPHVTVVWMWPIESYALSQKRWAADDSVPNSHLSDSWFIATSKSNYFSKKIELWQFEDDSTVDCLGHTKWPESGWFHLISHLLHNRCILQDYFWDMFASVYTM